MRLAPSILPVGLGLAAELASAAYVLQDDYSPATFFDKFTFFTDRDPTNGFVHYVDRETAQSQGLVSTGSSVYMGVDHTNTASSGRQSVRLSSTQSYRHGLFIIDLGHMPTGCGTWPAFWILGPNWPNGGEIDIIENVNDATNNLMTLHTGDGCTIDSTGFSGSAVTTNCYVQAPGQSNNAGCGIQSMSAASYGAGFNSNGGGVYATEWTSDAISIWFFPKSGIPSDITAGTPNPASWGTPAARFKGNCNIDQHFSSSQIIFDITFCGDWAGATWGSSSCGTLGTCQNYVANTPSAFTEAYWQINSLKVYQDSAAAKRAVETESVTADLPYHPRGFPRRSLRDRRW
ncbi:concanavalin A-like lectin/glucanase domain-containing protein [Aspergillus californicus]